MRKINSGRRRKEKVRSPRRNDNYRQVPTETQAFSNNETIHMPTGKESSVHDTYKQNQLSETEDYILSDTRGMNTTQDFNPQLL
jgi:hypothetical protein